ANWVGLHGLNVDPLALRVKKSARYLELLASSWRPMYGALELLKVLYGNKTLALASSSYQDAVDGVLEGLNIAHYFKAIVTGLDVPRVKPAPDIFLTAARRIGVVPSECVVIAETDTDVM